MVHIHSAVEGGNRVCSVETLVKNSADAVDLRGHVSDGTVAVLLDKRMDAGVAKHESRGDHGRIDSRLAADGAEGAVFRESNAACNDLRWLWSGRQWILRRDCALVAISVPPFQELEEEYGERQQVLRKVDHHA